MVSSIEELLLYQLPNYFLAVVFWSLLGRMVLALFVTKNPSNYIYLFFCRLTDWYLRLLIPITPRFMPPMLQPIYAIFFLILARFLFWVIAYNLGFAPQDVIPN